MQGASAASRAVHARLRRSASALLLGSAWLPQLAHAEPIPAAHLSWVRSDDAGDCPAAPEIQADVTRRLGFSPFEARSGSAQAADGSSIEVAVTREGAGYRAAISMRSVEGTLLGSRTVQSTASSCASLGSAAALAIALMFDPTLGSEEHPAHPAPLTAEPRAEPQSPEPKPEAPPAPPNERPQPPRRNHHDFAVGAVGAVGVLPRAAVGARLGAGFAIDDSAIVRAELGYLPGQRVEQDGAEVEFSSGFGSLAACYRLPLAMAAVLDGCAAVLLSALQIAVFAPSPVAPGQRTTWAGGLGAHLGIPLGALELGTDLEAFVPFTRRAFQVSHGAEPASVVFEQPAWFVIASLGIGARY